MVREIHVPAAQMKVLDDGRVERVLLTLLEVLLPGPTLITSLQASPSVPIRSLTRSTAILFM